MERKQNKRERNLILIVMIMILIMIIYRDGKVNYDNDDYDGGVNLGIGLKSVMYDSQYLRFIISTRFFLY